MKLGTQVKYQHFFLTSSPSSSRGAPHTPHTPPSKQVSNGSEFVPPLAEVVRAEAVPF